MDSWSNPTNIFVLDEDPKLAAQYHCDEDVIVMITETALILSDAYYTTGEGNKAPFKQKYPNHPCTRWAAESTENWDWLWQLGICLCEEYRYRFWDEGRSESGDAIVKMGFDRPKLTASEITARPQCVPPKFKDKDVVQAYRNFYASRGRSGLSYSTRERPLWMPREKAPNYRGR